MIIKRGQVYFADLSPVKGSEQGGLRPVVIIQNDKGNLYSPTTIVATITSKMSKAKLPTHIEVKAGEGGLSVKSIVLCEQIRTIDKSRLFAYHGIFSEETMARIDKALKISLGV